MADKTFALKFSIGTYVLDIQILNIVEVMGPSKNSQIILFALIFPRGSISVGLNLYNPPVLKKSSINANKKFVSFLHTSLNHI